MANDLVELRMVAEGIANHLEHNGALYPADPLVARLRLALGLGPDPFGSEK